MCKCKAKSGTTFSGLGLGFEHVRPARPHETDTRTPDAEVVLMLRFYMTVGVQGPSVESLTQVEPTTSCILRSRTLLFLITPFFAKLFARVVNR